MYKNFFATKADILTLGDIQRHVRLLAPTFNRIQVTLQETNIMHGFNVSVHYAVISAQTNCAR